MDIIVDIDGTLSDPTHRLHLIQGDDPKWDEFYDLAVDDLPHETMCELVAQLMGEGNRVIFVTGRIQRIRRNTVTWLSRALECECDDIVLMMRKDGDHRKDDVVKNEMLQSVRQFGYEPKLAIEDRARIVKMYRQEGLLVLQCAEGDY